MKIPRCASHFKEKPQVKIIIFEMIKIDILNKALKGNVVNLASPSFHGGALEYKITIPLKGL